MNRKFNLSHVIASILSARLQHCHTDRSSDDGSTISHIDECYDVATQKEQSVDATKTKLLRRNTENNQVYNSEVWHHCRECIEACALLKTGHAGYTESP